MTRDFKTVQDVLDNYKSSVYKKDVEGFLAAYSPDIHLFDCWGSWECRGISEWKESVSGWVNGLSDEGVLLKVDFSDVDIVEDSTIAFVHCAVAFAAYDPESDKKLRQMKNRFTFALKKENESWRITHEHSSLPIDEKTMKGIFFS